MKKLFLLLSFILVVVVGCGNGHVSGSGTVKYSTGELVPNGTIFFSTPQFNYTGTINNGVFELGGLKKGDGLPPGQYKVHLIGTEITESTDDIPLFDAKFNNPETSGIIIEVKSGEKNRFEITVEKPSQKEQQTIESDIPVE
ncbi:MAG: carboxypeptidase-like regulatory domain-containing protein [Planctomycetaceae bacterium]|jgi:hypothetical protein|nr:carboxypeptidase-like regulatory domain-containing protein [Planctomycetaceae bacterium]